MRFSDLFIEYKLGLKSINNIPFSKIPCYKKIYGCFILIYLICVIIYSITNLTYIYIIVSSIFMFFTIGMFIYENTDKRLKEYLEKFSKPNYKRRIYMIIKLLKKYKIDIKNPNTIDLLIEEAKIAQKSYNYNLYIMTFLKMISVIVIPILVNYIDNITNSNIIIFILVCLVILFLVGYYFKNLIIKDVFMREYNKYDEFIYDLRQIKIFYSK